MHADSTGEPCSPLHHRTRLLPVAAVLFFAIHLPFLAPTLEDIDSINFALGVRQFDPAEHQPHPPGYPVFIALGRLSTTVIDLVRPGGVTGARAEASDSGKTAPSVPFPDNAALALAWWSVLFGALATWPLFGFFSALDGRGSRTAMPALALTLACPLFWTTALRPLSDMAGFALAVAAQAMLARAVVLAGGAGPGDSHPPVDQAVRRRLVAASLVSGLALGVRSQTLWLTLPLLGVVFADRARRRDAASLIGGLATLGGSILLWAIPLVAATGGLARYLAALASQGSEDFSGVDMLWTQFSPRRALLGLERTFVWPWAAATLAAVVLGLALIGTWRVIRRAPTAAWLLCWVSVPYAVFHLLFHETITTRYALPLVPAVAYLAAHGSAALGRRGRIIVTSALIVACLALAVRPMVRYGRDGSPAMRLLADLQERGTRATTRPVLAMHRRVQSETRRAMRWAFGDSAWWSERLPAPAQREWLELVDYWRRGGRAPVWFLADPARTDLALVDPRARRLIRQGHWPFAIEPLLGGIRPGNIDWYAFEPPGWFLGEGWALTPETAGVAGRDARGPGHGPVTAWVRRRGGPAVLLWGGRNLGGSADPVVRFDVAWEGRLLDTAIVAPAPGFFLRLVDVPAGMLAGGETYGLLTVAARPVDGTGVAAAAIEQFDLQDASEIVFGFGRGWHELEFNPSTGRLWRWSAASAELQVHAPGRDVVVRVSGDVPLRAFGGVPHVVLRAGEVVLARVEPRRAYPFQPTVAFACEAHVTSGVLARASGVLTLETDRTFVPAERVGGGDRRRLGLRVYRVTVEDSRLANQSRW